MFRGLTRPGKSPACVFFEVLRSSYTRDTPLQTLLSGSRAEPCPRGLLPSCGWVYWEVLCRASVTAPEPRRETARWLEALSWLFLAVAAPSSSSALISSFRMLSNTSSAALSFPLLPLLFCFGRQNAQRLFTVSYSFFFCWQGHFTAAIIIGEQSREYAAFFTVFMHTTAPLNATAPVHLHSNRGVPTAANQKAHLPFSSRLYMHIYPSTFACRATPCRLSC